MGPAIIQTSVRDFARDSSIRRKAQKSNRPIMLVNKRAEEVFFVFPPKLYDQLYEWYEDMRDVELVEAAMKTKEKSYSLEEIKRKYSQS